MQLEQALERIFNTTPIMGVEGVDLGSCCGRVAAGENPAILPVPCYDQSSRDGYVLSGDGIPIGAGEQAFRICGEIQAGPGVERSIVPGESYRIMTGGLIPRGADRVVPQEVCRVEGADVIVDQEVLVSPAKFICRGGSERAAGEALTKDGTLLDEIHAARFAASGNHRVEVYKKPRVAFLCSGSELVIPGDMLQRGQKFSSNHYLLKLLIERSGGIGCDYGVVADEPQRLEQLLREIVAADVDMIISTGGVGPGKYDLFSTVLPALDADIRYRSLQVRPGRSTLFGTIGTRLYFGLPGPPSAVHIIFQECVRPALRKMLGYHAWRNRQEWAVLNHEISLQRSDVLCFREGVFALAESGLTVGFPDRFQTPNSLIILEPGISSYARGDRVRISLLEF